MADARAGAGEVESWVKRVGTGLASVLGVLAFAVSAYGVYVQRDQALAQREQVRAMVWPRLQWSHTDLTTDAGREFGFNLENCGVGPAEIRSVHITFDGKPMHTWEDLTKAMLDAGGSPGTSFDADMVESFLKNRVIGGNTAMKPLHSTHPQTAATLARVKNRVDVEICYCSVLEECWTLRTSKEDTNEKTPLCPRVADGFDQ
jgi:hypothetical protein